MFVEMEIPPTKKGMVVEDKADGEEELSPVGQSMTIEKPLFEYIGVGAMIGLTSDRPVDFIQYSRDHEMP